MAAQINSFGNIDMVDFAVMKTNSPFSISPNPNLFYLTPSLHTVLHKLRYTIENRRGLTAITGSIGLGKSSLVRLVYSEYAAREDYHIAFIPNPNFNSEFGLFKAICAEFGLKPRASMYDQEKEMLGWLLKQLESDKNVVVILDEAQVLNQKMLERVRSMLNIETNATKLIQVVLCGQLELDLMIDKPNNKALKSRIFAPSTLSPLGLEEVKLMIEFRCERQGVPCPVPDDLFTSIYDITGGIPREVLKLCDVAYELMNLAGFKHFDKEIIQDASEEYTHESKVPEPTEQSPNNAPRSTKRRK